MIFTAAFVDIGSAFVELTLTVILILPRALRAALILSFAVFCSWGAIELSLLHLALIRFRSFFVSRGQTLTDSALWVPRFYTRTFRIPLLPALIFSVFGLATERLASVGVGGIGVV